MIQVLEPSLLMIPANVPSTLAENEADLVRPEPMTVTVTPDIVETTVATIITDVIDEHYEIKQVHEVPVVKPATIIQSDIAYRIGGTPLFKDKVKAISTSRMRIDYSYLADRLESRSDYMILEGIDALIKIGSDLRYHRSVINELIRGINDKSAIVRNACLNGLSKIGSLSVLAIIDQRVGVISSFLKKDELHILNQELDVIRKNIKKHGPMRSCMLRIFEASNSSLELSVPPLYGFHD